MTKQDSDILKDLIGKSDYKQVFKLLTKHRKEFLNNEAKQNEFYLLKNEFENISQKQRLGLRLNQETKNEFAWKLLNFIDFISKPNNDEKNLIELKNNKHIEKSNFSMAFKFTILGFSVIGFTVAIQSGFTIGGILTGILISFLLIIGAYLYTNFM